jgi:hypothetical protein
MLPLKSSNFRRIYKYSKIRKDMEDNEPRFGMSKAKNPYERYTGSYVLIGIRGNGGYSGKYMGMEGDYLILNPFQTGVYNKDGKLVQILKEGEKMVNGREIATIEPVTLTEIENYCIAMNNRLCPPKLTLFRKFLNKFKKVA